MAQYIKRTVFTFICTSLLCISTFAQNTWFKHYDLGFVVETSVFVESAYDKLFTLTWTSNHDTIIRNQIICFDLSGNILWRRFIQYPDEDIKNVYFLAPRGMVIAKDSSIYVLSTSYALMNQEIFLVNKFDISGKFHWMTTHAYMDTDIFPAGYGICLEPDSMNIVIAGTLDRGSEDEKIILCRMDTSGMVIDEYVLDVTESRIDPYIPIVSLQDSSILLAYSHRGNHWTVRDYLLRSLGDNIVDDFRMSQTPTGARNLALHPNGSLIYLSLNTNEPDWQQGGMRVHCLTQTLETVWTYFYNDGLDFNGRCLARNLSIAPNGNILVYGSCEWSSRLLCVDPQGNKLWDREIRIGGGFTQRAYEGATWTSDNGIAITGRVFWYSSECEWQQCEGIFLMKLDSMGCLTPGCDETIITDVRDFILQRHIFLVYPNPTQGILTMTYTGDHYHTVQHAQVRIHDVRGTTVNTSVLSGPVTHLDIRSQPPGVYMVSVTSDVGLLYSGKIVKTD